MSNLETEKLQKVLARAGVGSSIESAGSGTRPQSALGDAGFQKGFPLGSYIFKRFSSWFPVGPCYYSDPIN